MPRPRYPSDDDDDDDRMKQSLVLRTIHGDDDEHQHDDNHHQTNEQVKAAGDVIANSGAALLLCVSAPTDIAESISEPERNNDSVQQQQQQQQKQFEKNDTKNDEMEKSYRKASQFDEQQQQQPEVIPDSTTASLDAAAPPTLSSLETMKKGKTNGDYSSPILEEGGGGDTAEFTRQAIEERQVFPGAVAVRGIAGSATHGSFVVFGSYRGDELDTQPVPLEEDILPSLLLPVAGEVDVQGIRSTYAAKAKEKLLQETMQVPAITVVDDDDPKPLARSMRFWIIIGLVVTIVLAAVLTAVLVVVTRPDHGNNPEPPPTEPPSVCARPDILSSHVDFMALQNASDLAAVPMCGHFGGVVFCSYHLGLEATQARTWCSMTMGGTYIEESFTIQCNSSMVNNRTVVPLIANFQQLFVCVPTTCNISQVESYLESQIRSRIQWLETNTKTQNCQAVDGTYVSYQNSSQQQQQQERFLPLTWGDQCAMENNDIVPSSNITVWYNSSTSILPSCQRNDTAAICSYDYTVASTLIGPWCEQFGASQFRSHDLQFQCTAPDGSLYTAEYWNQPTCTGVRCASSQVQRHVANLVQSSLLDQGHDDCQLVVSSTTSANASERPLNHSFALVGKACTSDTAIVNSDSRLATLNARMMIMSANTIPTPSCQADTTDFSSLAQEAHNLCTPLGGQYATEDVTIVCDSTTADGNDTCGYSFRNVFVCMASACDSKEVQAYLEGPLVALISILEKGGNVQHCRVAYGFYNVDPGPMIDEYLPSVWGAGCASEHHVLSSNTTLKDLSQDSIIFPTCRPLLQDGPTNCSYNYQGITTKIQALCPLVGGNYSEMDVTITCDSPLGSSTVEFLSIPLCTGHSCNVNQSAAAAVERSTFFLEQQGYQNCRLPPFQGNPPSFSSVSFPNVFSGQVDECSAATNILSNDAQWKETYGQYATSDDNHGTFTNDFRSYAGNAQRLCQDVLNGKYVAFNYTVGNCVQQDSIYTYKYVQDFYCLGRACNQTQIQSYFEGVLMTSALTNNCSQILG